MMMMTMEEPVDAVVEIKEMTMMMTTTMLDKTKDELDLHIQMTHHVHSTEEVTLGDNVIPMRTIRTDLMATTEAIAIGQSQWQQWWKQQSQWSRQWRKSKQWRQWQQSKQQFQTSKSASRQQLPLSIHCRIQSTLWFHQFVLRQLLLGWRTLQQWHPAIPCHANGRHTRSWWWRNGRNHRQWTRRNVTNTAWGRKRLHPPWWSKGRQRSCSTEVTVHSKINDNKKGKFCFKTLFDSGSVDDIISKDALPKDTKLFTLKSTVNVNTADGMHRCKQHINLHAAMFPELSPTQQCKIVCCHVIDQKRGCQLIIERKRMKQIGLKMDFRSSLISWHGEGMVSHHWHFCNDNELLQKVLTNEPHSTSESDSAQSSHTHEDTATECEETDLLQLAHNQQHFSTSWSRSFSLHHSNTRFSSKDWNMRNLDFSWLRMSCWPQLWCKDSPHQTALFHSTESAQSCQERITLPAQIRHLCLLSLCRMGNVNVHHSQPRWFLQAHRRLLWIKWSHKASSPPTAKNTRHLPLKMQLPSCHHCGCLCTISHFQTWCQITRALCDCHSLWQTMMHFITNGLNQQSFVGTNCCGRIVPGHARCRSPHQWHWNLLQQLPRAHTDCWKHAAKASRAQLCCQACKMTLVLTTSVLAWPCHCCWRPSKPRQEQINVRITVPWNSCWTWIFHQNGQLLSGVLEALCWHCLLCCPENERETWTNTWTHSSFQNSLHVLPDPNAPFDISALMPTTVSLVHSSNRKEMLLRPSLQTFTCSNEVSNHWQGDALHCWSTQGTLINPLGCQNQCSCGSCPAITSNGIMIQRMLCEEFAPIFHCIKGPNDIKADPPTQPCKEEKRVLQLMLQTSTILMTMTTQTLLRTPRLPMFPTQWIMWIHSSIAHPISPTFQLHFHNWRRHNKKMQQFKTQHTAWPNGSVITTSNAAQRKELPNVHSLRRLCLQQSNGVITQWDMQEPTNHHNQSPRFVLTRTQGHSPWFCQNFRCLPTT